MRIAARVVGKSGTPPTGRWPDISQGALPSHSSPEPLLLILPIPRKDKAQGWWKKGQGKGTTLIHTFQAPFLLVALLTPLCSCCVPTH